MVVLFFLNICYVGQKSKQKNNENIVYPFRDQYLGALVRD